MNYRTEKKYLTNYRKPNKKNTEPITDIEFTESIYQFTELPIGKIDKYKILLTPKPIYVPNLIISTIFKIRIMPIGSHK